MPTIRMSLSALVTQALKQIYDSFIAAAESLLVVVRGTTESYVCQLLIAAVTAECSSAECMDEQDVQGQLGFFEGLGGVQPQVRPVRSGPAFFKYLESLLLIEYLNLFHSIFLNSSHLQVLEVLLFSITSSACLPCKTASK